MLTQYSIAGWSSESLLFVLASAVGLIGDYEMNYNKQIEALERQQQVLEDKIMELLKKQAKDKIDLNSGDQVIIKSTDAIAVVNSSWAVASHFHGERYVEILVSCNTRSGKTHVLQRCEVEKL